MIGEVRLADDSDYRPISPGRFPRHYAPKTPMYLCDSIPVPPRDKQAGLLVMQTQQSHPGFAGIEILSDKGCLSDAAANLYSAMIRMDKLNLDMIYAIRVKNTGIGIAINDRLYRACQKSPELCRCNKPI